MDVLQHFNLYIKQKNLADKSFLLAVSGGMDSMVLLHLFKQKGLSFSIAHVNFMLRGDESDADESFVKEHAKDTEHFIKRFNTSSYASENNLSVQMAARELRYEWFEELKKEHGFDYIVTAHHANDNAETMLLNFIRGRSLKSIAGIHEHDSLLRPLLACSRNDLLQYANAHGLKWRDDSSNATDDYDRNFLRHHVIPLLQKLNPSLEKSMLTTKEMLNEAASLTEAEFSKWKGQFVFVKENVVSVHDLEYLFKHPLKSNFLFLLLRPYEFPSQVMHDIGSALHPSGKRFYAPGHTLTFDRNQFYIEANAEDIKKAVYSISGTGVWRFPGIVISVEENILPSDPVHDNNILYADADKLSFPLTLRHWKEGDYFFPSGMNGSKKLSDYFIDRKIPVAQKARLWLLVSGEDIVWIAGYRSDERFRAQPAGKVLKITFAADVGTTGF